MATTMRSKLDDLVWSDEKDPFSSTLIIAQDVSRSTREQLASWAHAQHTEYARKHRQIRLKCDIRDAGVFVIYEHYVNISERYWSVAGALSI